VPLVNIASIILPAAKALAIIAITISALKLIL
jgi:hypothetical protein